jgi:hypothetical protein
MYIHIIVYIYRMREIGTLQALVLLGGASALTKSGSESGSQGIPEAGAPGDDLGETGGVSSPKLMVSPGTTRISTRFNDENDASTGFNCLTMKNGDIYIYNVKILNRYKGM